jgi:hypothetical protein
MGAQWQVFIQAVGDHDRGGTACWMGQNYSSLGPWIPEGQSYSQQGWAEEIERIGSDPASGRLFQKGDLVLVTARKSLFYGGKLNINEAHRVEQTNNFSIELIAPRFGLPDPDVIRLEDLVAADDGDPGTHEDLFDPSRESGGEHYQGMRVCLSNIRLSSEYYGSAGWDAHSSWADRLCTVTDGKGRFFTLRMPRTDLGPPPEEWFSAVGILNQESGSGSDGTYGYELFVQEIGPKLNIFGNGGKVMIFWPADYGDAALEYSTSIDPESEWLPVETLPRKFFVVEEPLTEEPSRFFRLRLQD